jgi:hypothetical protein
MGPAQLDPGGFAPADPPRLRSRGPDAPSAPARAPAARLSDRNERGSSCVSPYRAMNEASRSYGLWRAAEESGRDDEADCAFRTVFQTAMPEHPVSPDFATRTMAAVVATAVSDARRARRVRAGVLTGTAVASAAAVYFGLGWAISFASTAFIAGLNMLITFVVRGAVGFQTGAGFWSVLASLGRAATALAADPSVTFAMIAISAVAIAALLALQRLLGSDGESFR